MNTPLSIGCIGAGGYARAQLTQFSRHIPPQRARLVGATVSGNESLGDIPGLDAHGAKPIGSVDELLAMDLDGVIVPTSIDSHLPLSRAAMEAGAHVLCEKPVTATIEDALEMIRIRDRTDKVVAIGYQDTYSPSVQWAKRQILDGRIGAVQQVRLWATWPRTDSYYRRNDWVGRVQRDGRWVLDSPANNALSHQINLALYLTGPEAETSNRATAIEAELYRARDLENFDTCAYRLDTAAGCPLLVLLTHACEQANHPVIEYIGERGTLRRTHPRTCELLIDGEVVDQCEDDEAGAHGPMLTNWLDAIEGRVGRPHCAIENGMEVTRVNNAASEATPVHAIDKQYLQRAPIKPDAPDDLCTTIRGIESVFQRCFERMALPGELGDVPWAQPPGSLDMTDYTRFGGLPATDGIKQG